MFKVLPMTPRGSVPYNLPIRIVTDGASRGNPGPGGWAALIIRDGQITELGGHVANTTNNRMELLAAVAGLRAVPAATQIELFSDSMYLIDGATRWLASWKQRNWLTMEKVPVQHRDLWEELDVLAGNRVRWQHVKGHTGDAQNERANAIAQAHAYGLPIPAANRARPAGMPADGVPRYLSLVGGRLMRHSSWEACKARVHGVAATKYKKCSSYAEELATLQGWGVAAELLEGL
jgi:ribonuclease HI